jgi:type IV pilus assembly protein PilX
MRRSESCRGRSRLARARQRGYLLVTGLLFLVALTLLGIALFRSTGLMDRISANTRDKERAFEAAQSALQYAEWWLQSGHGGAGTECTTLASGNNPDSVHVCSNALAKPSDLPWTAGYTYTPPNFTVNTAGGLISATNPDVNYQAAPTFYIERLGTTADGQSTMYQVTAAGRGGSPDTMAVVRSTYAINSSTKALDNP